MSRWQDSKYIATYPDTLIGTWLALDRADEENGCLWVVPGSNNEPVFPEVEGNIANVHATGAFDIEPVANTSNLDDGVNSLSRVAQQYGEETWLPVVVEPGDVIMCTLTAQTAPPPNRPDPTRSPAAAAAAPAPAPAPAPAARNRPTARPNRQIRPRIRC